MEQDPKTSSKLGLIISVVALILAACAYFCPKKTAEPSTGPTGFDEKVRTIAVDVIQHNPKLLVDAFGAALAQQKEDFLKQISNEVYTQKEEITKQSMQFGNLESKSTIICFFDPFCKHCVEFQKSMVKLTKSKKDVCFKLIPIIRISEDSVPLAKAYIAAYDKSPEKALVFIEKITVDGNAMDKDSIEKAIKAAGLSVKEIEGMLAAADEKLASNCRLSQKLNIPGVPAIFSIKGSNAIVVQTVGVNELSDIIDSKEDVNPAIAKPEEKAKEEATGVKPDAEKTATSTDDAKPAEAPKEIPAEPTKEEKAPAK